MHENGLAVISLAGDVTWQTSSHLRDRLTSLMRAGNRKVVVNMAAVGFVDSSGLAVVIAANRRLHAMGGSLILVNVPDAIMRALTQARLCELIPTRGKSECSHERILTAPPERPLMVKTKSVPADPALMAQTRREVTSLYEGMGLEGNDVFDLTLAFGEALGNAFDHGCTCDADGMVTVTVARYSDRVITEVCDCGPGCGKYEAGDALPTPSETRGRGIRLMAMLADGVSIEPKAAGHGTKVRLVKMLKPPVAAKELDVREA